MTKEVENALKKVGEGNCVHLVLSDNDYLDYVCKKLTNHLVKSISSLIYISAHRPPSVLKKYMSKSTLDSVLFVDMVSGSTSVFSNKVGNTFFTPKENSLNELGLLLFSKKHFGLNKRFIVIDNITSLGEKYGYDAVKRFASFMKSGLKMRGDSALSISTSDDYQGAEVCCTSGLCKKILRIENI